MDVRRLLAPLAVVGAVLASIAVLGGTIASPSSAASVVPTPVAITSNLSCSYFEPDGVAWEELTVDPNADGVYDDGTLKVEILNTTDDKVFDWRTLDFTTETPPGLLVQAVYVKAGDGGSNLYVYPGGAVSDTALTSPGAGTTNQISHISFCYLEPDGVTQTPVATGSPSGTRTVTRTVEITGTVEIATETPTPTATSTVTPTDTPEATETPSETNTPTATGTSGTNFRTSTPVSTSAAGAASPGTTSTPLNAVLGATEPAGGGPTGISALPSAGAGFSKWAGSSGGLVLLSLVGVLFAVSIYAFWRARQEI